VRSWVVFIALLAVIITAALVHYLPTLSGTALLAGFAFAVVSAVVVLYLPTWASVFITVAILVVVVIGGETLLVKTLIIGGLVLLARWLWRRYVPR
jgi:hypothetical protein